MKEYTTNRLPTDDRIKKIEVRDGKIISPKPDYFGKRNLFDGTYVLKEEVEEAKTVETSEKVTKKSYKNVLELVEASKLSLNDEFMKHIPRGNREKNLKKLLNEVIKRKIPDFYVTIYDPSFSEDGTKIEFAPDKLPAVDKNFNQWRKLAKEFWPEKGSQLGTKLQYAAFLGVLIKMLVEAGWSIDGAWNAVCNDSKKLGHYSDAKEAIDALERTGSRKVFRFCDLANTYKYIEDDFASHIFYIAGGAYNCKGSEAPLAEIVESEKQNTAYSYCVGWIVIPCQTIKSNSN